MTRFNYTATGGENSVTSVSLIGKTVLSVVKDGVAYTKILLSGSSTPKHARYNSASGSVGFGLLCDQGEEIYVLYEDL